MSAVNCVGDHNVRENIGRFNVGLFGTHESLRSRTDMFRPA